MMLVALGNEHVDHLDGNIVLTVAHLLEVNGMRKLANDDRSLFHVVLDHGVRNGHLHDIGGQTRGIKLFALDNVLGVALDGISMLDSMARQDSHDILPRLGLNIEIDHVFMDERGKRYCVL